MIFQSASKFKTGGDIVCFGDGACCGVHFGLRATKTFPESFIKTARAAWLTIGDSSVAGDAVFVGDAVDGCALSVAGDS